MIPVRDSIPNVHRPWGVWLLIVLNTLVFVVELGLTDQQLMHFFMTFGVVPARYFDPSWMPGEDMLTHLLPFVSYMFVHSGWAHFLLNMWVLWIFADNIEDVMGTGRFLAFYTLCGMIALIGHMAANAGSDIPVVGASGAIAGVMGAYMILYPHGRVMTFIPIFFIPYFFEVPALIFLAVWFFIQLFSGLSMAVRGQEGGVAFMAHAAGFVAGIVLLPLFKNKARCYYCYDKTSRRYVDTRQTP